MYYEVRDLEKNKLLGVFNNFDEAKSLIVEYSDNDDFEIVQLFTEEDKKQVSDKLIKRIKNSLVYEDKLNIYKIGYRICDINVINGYDINELFIKILIVDGYHSIMLLSYLVIINDSLEVVKYEQIRKDYLS